MDGPSEPEDVCHSCGARLKPSDNFCPSCGADTGKTSSTVTSTTQVSSEIGSRRMRDSKQRGGRSPPGLPGLSKDSEPGWRPILTGFGLALISIILLVVFSVLSIPVTAIFGLSTGAALILGVAIGQYFGFFGLALAYLRYSRDFDWQRIRDYLGVRVPTLRELGVVIGGYFGIIGLVIVVSLIIQFLSIEPAQNESANELVSTASADPILIVGVFALMFLVIGPCEEILYRGVIQNRIRERYSKIPAIAAASIIFASVHIIAFGSTDPIAILTTISVLSVTALVLGAVYEYTGNLVVPTLLHALHNSVIVMGVLFAPEAQSGLLAPVFLLAI